MFSFMARLKREERGFTLIELMVVVAIIAILVAIAIPAYLSATSNAKVKTHKANLRTIDGAINTYAAENGVNPPDGTIISGTTTYTALVGTYLKAAPKNPFTATYNYTVTSGVAASGSWATKSTDLPNGDTY